MTFSQNAILIPTGDFHIIQLKPEGYVEGVTIDLRNINFSFTKAAIYLNATDIFQYYEQTHMLKDINILGKHATSGWTGTGILMEATTPMSYIDNVKCNNITITNMKIGVHLRVDKNITKESDMAWVNANFFHQMTLMNFEYGLYLEGDSKVPRDVGGNFFDQVQFQAERERRDSYIARAVQIDSIFSVGTFIKLSLQKPHMNFQNPPVLIRLSVQWHKKLQRVGLIMDI